MSVPVLSLLIALPCLGGVCALAFGRGGRWAGLAFALLALALATWAGQRLGDPRVPNLEQSWQRIVAQRVAVSVGGAASSPLPVTAGERIRWSPAEDEVVQRRFVKLLVSGAGEERSAAALDDLSGWATTERDVLTLEVQTSSAAAVSSLVTLELDRARLARDRSVVERARLGDVLGRLRVELHDLRVAGLGPHAHRFSLIEQRPWLLGLRAQWLLGADGLSLALIWLVSLLGPLCAMSCGKGRAAGLILLTQGLLVGAFCALDAVLLSAFWVLLLLPTYALLGGGPGSDGDRVARRALLPAFLGALVLLGALLTLSARAAGGSTNLLVLFDAASQLAPRSQALLFVALFLACAVRMPLPPLHGWLPALTKELDAPAAAFVQGSVLTLGAYGLFRLAWPLCPAVVGDPRVATGLALFGVATVAFASLAALAARDLQRVLALTSVGHAGLVLFGLACATATSTAGAALEVISHGLAMTAACLAYGALVERTNDGDISAMGGFAERIPRLAGVAALASACLFGFPGLVGFVARLSLFTGGLGSTLVPRWVVGLALASFVLAGLGLWWTFQRVFLGEAHASPRMRDLSGVEGASQVPLVMACVALGLAPPLLLELISN